MDEDEDLTADLAQPLAGLAYRPANEQAATTTERVPFSVDPNEQDRALRAHATAQNVLASWVAERGWTAISPAPGDPAFDVAWRRGQETFVAEVKSILPMNEVRQLRLGLGQVLDYAHELGASPVLFSTADQRATDGSTSPPRRESGWLAVRLHVARNVTVGRYGTARQPDDSGAIGRFTDLRVCGP